MRRYFYRVAIFIAIALLYNQVSASDAEQSRLLVHALSYLANDYGHAVDNNRTVLSETEYKEMKEFSESALKSYAENARLWKNADTATIGKHMRRIAAYVVEKETPEKLQLLATETRALVLKASGLSISPEKYPNLANGKKVFALECAKCHGDNGYGDGKEGIGLEPAPRNFHEESRIGGISPFAAFNTVRLGVEGTGMKAHPALSDDEVWDVSWYVIALRYTKDAEDIKEDKRYTLEQLANTTDNILKSRYKLTGKEIAQLRLQQPEMKNNTFLSIAVTNLDNALKAYINGDYTGAGDAAALAYLEGVEPVELSLRASDPQLAERLERQLLGVRKLITDRVLETQLSDSVAAAKITLAQAGEVLDNKEYSFAMAFFMAASILLREGLEAFLVIMVILSILNKAALRSSKKYVHAGWITAVLIGVGLWFASAQLIQQGKGMTRIEIIEGAVSLLAVVMLLYIGFWLHNKSEIEKWKAYVAKMVKNAMDSRSAFWLVGLSFFVVFREVFESVLFLSAINIESKGTQEMALGAGVLSAFLLVIAFAFIVLRFSAKLPIPKLFRISSIMMGILSIVLIGKGIHSFQEIGAVPVHGIPFIRIELLGVFPTIESLAAQVLVTIGVYFLLRTKGSNAKSGSGAINASAAKAA
jgi:high-affinity iron transporter